MKKNKILYVSTVDMYSNTGGGLVTNAFYKAYKSIFQEKVVLMHAEEYYKDGCNNTNIVLIKRRSRLYKIFNFLGGHVHRFYPDIITYLGKHKDEYAECVINGGVYAGDSIERIKDLGIIVTVIHHNFERQYHMDNKTIASFYGKSAFWVNHWERKSYLLADNNLFLTQYDLSVFKDTYGQCSGQCYCIGSFMPTSTTLPINKLKKEEKYTTIVISGALDFPQSYNSIIRFYRDIFSQLNINDIKLIITGRNPAREIKSLERNRNVELVPSPKDIYEVINRGDIYICPIDCGGGIKMRIMDGLKCGKPVITHINSIRGYEYFMDKDYFGTYSDISEFSKTLMVMIERIKKNVISSEKIQDDYTNYFSLESGINRLKIFYNID